MFALSDGRCRRERAERGTVIYAPHRFRRCLAVVLAGRVQVNKGALIMSVLEPGDLFGVNQDYIDQYILNINANFLDEEMQEKELCKGLSLKTYNKIINYMIQKNGQDLTAEEIAKGSGLARVTARRYLEKMVEEGKVEINQEYGKIGRPTNYYILKK